MSEAPGRGSDHDPWATADPPALTRRQRRLRRLGLLAGFALLAGGLAVSTMRQTVPAGGSEAMSGMKMSPGMDHVGVTFRDLRGTTVDLPGGRPGAVLFMATDGCPFCIDAARKLAADLEEAGPQFQLTLVSLDTEESRGDFERFDRAAGGLDAHYALDDASASISSLFDVRRPGVAVVYDRDGMVLRRIDASTPSADRKLKEAIGAL